jgi:hypothetical protein
MKNTTDAEHAVARYLRFLADPDSLIDKAAVKAANKELNAAVDPMDRLHAAAALRRATTVDEAEIEAAFRSAAPAYAREHGLTEDDFAAMGVGKSLVRDVFAGRTARTPRAASAPKLGGSRGGIAKVTEHVLALGSGTTFLIADVLGVASQVTVRKALDEMVSAGTIKNLGPVSTGGRGRAPLKYQVA